MKLHIYRNLVITSPACIFYLLNQVQLVIGPGFYWKSIVKFKLHLCDSLFIIDTAKIICSNRPLVALQSTKCQGKYHTWISNNIRYLLEIHKYMLPFFGC